MNRLNNQISNQMDINFAAVKDYQPLVAAGVGLLVFGWSIIQFLVSRIGEARNREFDTYHKLIAELVRGNGSETHVDIQLAVVHELRNFKRYWPLSRRILKRLDATWSGNPNYHADLRSEIKSTISVMRGWFEPADLN